jgi:hypothetical protein
MSGQRLSAGDYRRVNRIQNALLAQVGEDSLGGSTLSMGSLAEPLPRSSPWRVVLRRAITLGHRAGRLSPHFSADDLALMFGPSSAAARPLRLREAIMDYAAITLYPKGVANVLLDGWREHTTSLVRGIAPALAERLSMLPPDEAVQRLLDLEAESGR